MAKKRTQCFMRFPGGLARALTLSYDDGVQQDRRLIEILNKHGIKATFNLNSGLYAPEDVVYPPHKAHRRLRESEILEVYGNSRHEVAVHTFTHPHLEYMTPGTIAYEIVKDRETLEAQFGCIIRGMAYPYGTYNDEVVAVLKDCGIAYARTVVSTKKFDIPTDWLRLHATCHHKDKDLMVLADKFVNGMKKAMSPQLFYLWGHSYEFEMDDNWNVIEEFAEFIGNREDIWYATNIEIYEYIEDYKRLIYSADGATVKNPTNRTLWLALAEGKLYSVAPGETLKID